MSAFPTHPDDVSPDWLNASVERLTSPVSQVSWEPIGTGQVGDSVRFSLAHKDGSQSSLAAKFPAADPVSRGTAAMMGLYAKEVRFYREVAPTLDLRVPDIHAAHLSDDGADFVLLFEDLGPARGGNQLDSCGIEDARHAIRQAAAFHAPSWGDETLLGADWLKSSDQLRAWIASKYPEAQATWAERYSDSLEPEFMTLCEEVAACEELFESRGQEAQCLVHGDFRLDNMLFDVKGGAEPIAVLDWQTVTTGKAMTDIGYFLGCGIGDCLRRAHEGELLGLYLDEMGKRGVTLEREAMWRDYRIGALHGLTTAVFSAAFVERTERGDANFLSMARGAAALALEHDSLSAVKEAAR